MQSNILYKCNFSIYLYLIFIVIFFLILLTELNADDSTDCRPANYSEFRLVEKELTQELVNEHSNLFLVDKTYIIDNPLIIDKKKCFFMHGLDRVHSKIEPKNLGEPLLIVRNSSLFNLTNIKLAQKGEDNINLLVNGDLPVNVELLDLFIEAGKLFLLSPGDYKVQGTYITGLGRVTTNILLDNPHANLDVIGGNIKHSGITENIDNTNFSHAHIKQGRFRIFGTGTQRTLGLTDFIIEAETIPGNPHQVINIRSEGSKTLKETPSSFVHVPRSNKTIDIGIINSSGAWRMSKHGESRFIEHYAEGDIILMGNTSIRGVSLVANAPKANVYAINNTVYGDSMGDVRTKNFYLKDNFFSNRKYNNSDIKPYVRKVADFNPISKSPKIEISPPRLIERVTILDALPGMINVKNVGVAPNSQEDQTELIQNALNKHKYVYFPEGIYHINKPIGVNPGFNTSFHNAGGYLAGAGSNKTRIINKESSQVFQTYGMAYATLQGFSLQGAKLKDGKAVVSLENKQDIGHATQELIFYDLNIEGGYKGIGIGETSLHQCSENMFIDVKIRNSNTGISVGNYNALANHFYNLNITNVNQGISHSGELSGGQWSVYSGEFYNVKDYIFEIINASNGIWYFDNIIAEGAKLLNTSHSSAPINVLFNSAKLANSSMKFLSGGGVIFNNTDTRDLYYENNSKLADNYINNIN